MTAFMQPNYIENVSFYIYIMGLHDYDLNHLGCGGTNRNLSLGRPSTSERFAKWRSANRADKHVIKSPDVMELSSCIVSL